MSNYTKLTDFAAKDALLSGNPNKLVKGTEIDNEFDAIEVAIATKADSTDISAMLETSDIGVLVQAYVPNISTTEIGYLDNATSNIQAQLNAKLETTSLGYLLKTTDIGVLVQAYDADIATVSASQAEMEAGTETALRSMSPLRVKQAISALATTPSIVTVRQTVLSGPVDSSGLSAFGGSTGSTTVTASGTLIATAAAGGITNYTGSITNPSWTGLSTNGTMYLYLDITSAGVVTTGSTTLAPNYQWGGTYSTTNGQNTYNIQESTMKVGNGATASQVYRVFAGEVTVSGGVTTAITWYALNGRYDSGWTTTLPSAGTTTVKSHNIGVDSVITTLYGKCVSTDNGYSTGDIIVESFYSNTYASSKIPIKLTTKTVGIVATSANPWCVNASGGTGAGTAIATLSNWAYRITAQRGW